MASQLAVGFRRLRQRLSRALQLVRRFFCRVDSVKLRLALAAVFVSLFGLGVTYAAVSRSSRETAAAEAQRRADDMLRLGSAMLGEAVAVNDRMQIHLFARALTDFSVDLIRITDDKANVLFASDSPQLAGRNLIVVAGPLTFSGKQVGELSLGFDRTQLEGRLQAAHAWVYSIVGLGFALFVGLGFFVLRSPFRTLGKLTVEAEFIRQGDLSRRVPVRGGDEFAQFCEAFNAMVASLSDARKAMLTQQLQAIQAMISAVEAKDAYTRGHCLRVRDNVSKIARQMGLEPELRERCEVAAVLHDVGKIGIPDEILLKPGSLTREEMAVIETHVTTGETILRHLDTLQDVAGWVRHHHERWDGTGYPDRLATAEIPLASRLIAVADAIDALTTERPYQSAHTVPEALEVLKRERGEHFDPEVVDAALEVFEAEYTARLENTRLTHA